MALVARIHAKIITKAWPVLIVLLPIVCIVFICVGFPQAEVENSVFNIWVRSRSEFRRDLDYADEVAPPSGSSSFLGIAVPRQSGNILTAKRLLEFRDRHLEMEKATVEVDGITFYFEDICSNAVGPYIFPCLRMTVLDCFKEGGYNFDEKAAVAWRALVMEELSIQDLIDSLKQPLIMTGLAQLNCASYCPNDGQHPVLASIAGFPEGTWASDPDCTECLDARYARMDDATKDAMYYFVANILVGMLMPGLNQEILMGMYNVSTPTEAIDLFLPTAGTTLLQQQLADKDPYTFQLLDPNLGQPRPSLQNGSQFMSDADVLKHASADCINWVHLLPPNVKLLLYGEPIPTRSSLQNPLTSAAALQSVYFLDRPRFIRTRVQDPNRPAAFGGPISISLDTAEKALKEYKQKISEVWSKGWDSGDVELEMTAFVDDAGASGTFANTLEEVTTSTGGLNIAFVIAIFLVTFITYISCNFVEMRSGTAFAGTFMACLCVLGAMGFTCTVGNKLNAVHLWCVPFLLLGVGIDDMFLVANAASNPMGATSEEKLENSMKEVLSPITMTSLMNFLLFLLMAVGSDIPGVYLAGVTGMVGIGFAYLTMTISFPCVIYLDIRRRDSKRLDFLCCVTSTKEGAREAKEYNYPYRFVYAPIMKNIIGRCVLLFVSLAVLVVALIHLPSLMRGLDLSDFFPSGTREGQYTDRRDQYFPTWPVRLCWGALKYEDPDVQLHMIKQWEGVLATEYIADEGLSSDRVWTAALATFMLPCCDDGVCEPGDYCGQTLDPVCRSTLKANTKGLRTVAEGGVCTDEGCPVIEGLTQEEISKCIGLWNNASFSWSLLSAGIVLDSDKKPEVPIRYSEAGGTSLFAFNLRQIGDYESLIESTRAVTDEDDSIGTAFMAGIPYSYFEQYLTVVEVVSTLSGVCLALGFVVAWLFLFGELSASGHGTLPQRLVASTVGAFIVAVFAGMAVCSTLGYNSVFEIKLNGFTAMAALLSLGLSVEYTVHVVHRFIQTDAPTALERVLVSMRFLFLPTFLGFLTTAISVLMLAFAQFTFVRKYYFAPLAITTLVTYLYGIFTLPALLSFCGCFPVLKARESLKETVAETTNPDPNVIGSTDQVSNSNPPESNEPPAAIQEDKADDPVQNDSKQSI